MVSPSLAPSGSSSDPLLGIFLLSNYRTLPQWPMGSQPRGPKNSSHTPPCPFNETAFNSLGDFSVAPAFTKVSSLAQSSSVLRPSSHPGARSHSPGPCRYSAVRGAAAPFGHPGASPAPPGFSKKLPVSGSTAPFNMALLCLD